jgi:hypothetical protein
VLEGSGLEKEGRELMWLHIITEGKTEEKTKKE